MMTLLFVHGTGGRKAEYEETYQRIQTALNPYQSEIKLAPCLWGDECGTKLNAGGASIPLYVSSGGDESLFKLWQNLYQDPLYEIRILSIQPMDGHASQRQLEQRVKDLERSASAELLPRLKEAGIDGVFNDALSAITGSESEPFEQLLSNVQGALDGVYVAIARAIVAEAIRLCEQRNIRAPISLDAALRDRTVDAITMQLTKQEQARGAVSDFIGKIFLTGVEALSNRYLEQRRGAVTNSASPASGDILLYQAKGEKIRNFINGEIEKSDHPVVLLAHSLGGIACVDLLVKKDLQEKVKLLITVGSQAPFLYEIDALQSLSFGEPLPPHFPQWLNIYDVRDVLSYVGDRKDLFFGRVKDVAVDTQQPFPRAHSAYWTREETWKSIVEAIRKIQEN